MGRGRLASMPAALPHLDAETLEGMSAQELRELTTRLLARIESDAQTLVFRQAKIDKLSAEIAQLRRLKFGVKSEKLDVGQRHLFEESVATDIAALEQELVELCESSGRPVPEVLCPKRAPLPAHLPQREVRHEPDSKVCTTPG